MTVSIIENINKNTMKKLTLILALLFISTFGFSQKMGIKLASTQTVVITDPVAAITMLADTISITSIVDNGISVSANMIIGTANLETVAAKKHLVLWIGSDYTSNHLAWTPETIIARIKVLLGVE